MRISELLNITSISEKRFADVEPKKSSDWKNIPIDDFAPDTDEEKSRGYSDVSKELFDLIDQSYAYVGGHTNYPDAESLSLGKPPDSPDSLIWKAIDVDGDQIPDAVNWYKRTPHGTKNVGAAINSQVSGAKDVIKKDKIALLNQIGNYAEVSGKPASMLLKAGVPVVTDKEIVKKVLNKPIEWIGEKPEFPGAAGWYVRTLGGVPHEKIMVGIPEISQKSEK